MFSLAAAGTLGQPLFAEGADGADLSRLINAGRLTDAAALLEQRDPTPADRLFFQGRVLKSQGKYEAAVEMFRAVLRAEPDYLNARRELAHTQLLMREYGAAQAQFENLLRIDPDPGMRDGYRKFLTLIDNNKPVGISGQFSLLPSSNVNRGTTNVVFDTTLGQFVIDPAARATAGVGVQLGLKGFLRQPLGPAGRVVLDWAMIATRYDIASNDSTTGILALSYQQVIKTGIWTFTPYVQKTVRVDEADNTARGLRFGLTQRIAPQSLLTFSLTTEKRIYETQTYQNGPYAGVSLLLSHAVTPSLSFTGGVGLDTSHPDAAHLRYDGVTVTGAVARVWTGGLTTRLNLSLGWRDFAGPYPLTSTPRADDMVRVGLDLQHSRIEIAGFTPVMTCSHTVNRSNVAFFDYTATECGVSLSRNF